jgi:hypothetical protein
MSRYAIYTNSGRVVRLIKMAAEDIKDNTLEGESALLIDSAFESSKIYIRGSAVELKTALPELDFSQSDNVVTVSGLPDDTIVIWPDSQMTTESVSFSFECNVSGSLRFYIDAPQYIAQWVNIYVT